MTAPANPRFIVPRPVAKPRVRLYCLPYAGGSASAYHAWARALPDDVELSGVQLPGRSLRIHEPPLRRLPELLRALLPRLERQDAPYVLFGHSMGALVAFELARGLRHLGAPPPAGLIVSGSRAPERRGASHDLHRLPDEDFLRELRRFEGLPEEVLRDPELLALTLPALRADFEMIETWQSEPEPPLPVRMAALGGTERSHRPCRGDRGLARATAPVSSRRTSSRAGTSSCFARLGSKSSRS